MLQDWDAIMEKYAEMAILLDIYGELLTEKQKDMMDQYYNYDLSLQEIAENEGITKQGVHDLIKRSEHTLYKTEEKLQFKDKLLDIQSGLNKIYTEMDELSQTLSTEKDSIAALEAWKKDINQLINKLSS